MSGGTLSFQGLDTNLPQAVAPLEISPLAQPQGPAWVEERWSKWRMRDMTIKVDTGSERYVAQNLTCSGFRIEHLVISNPGVK